MPRLVSPAKFSATLSADSGLKFKLAGLSFVFLAVPAALLMSFGVSEKYVLLAMVAAILPFQYIAFCVLEAIRRKETTIELVYSRRKSFEANFLPEHSILGHDVANSKMGDMDAYQFLSIILQPRGIVQLARSQSKYDGEVFFSNEKVVSA